MLLMQKQRTLTLEYRIKDWNLFLFLTMERESRKSTLKALVREVFSFQILIIKSRDDKNTMFVVTMCNFQVCSLHRFYKNWMSVTSISLLLISIFREIIHSTKFSVNSIDLTKNFAYWFHEFFVKLIKCWIKYHLIFCFSFRKIVSFWKLDFFYLGASTSSNLLLL